jgi:dipeptide/tripeptide permease
VFYFTNLLGNRDSGLLFHNYFFAALAIAPLFVGAFVTTLAGQRRAVYCGELLLILAFVVLAMDLNAYVAGIFLIAGVGLFNVSFKTVFSASMQRFDSEFDVHFTRLYLAINLGSF